MQVRSRSRKQSSIATSEYSHHQSGFGRDPQISDERADHVPHADIWVLSARCPSGLLLDRPWWVQAWPDHPFIPIRSDLTWSTETHLGYALTENQAAAIQLPAWIDLLSGDTGDKNKSVTRANEAGPREQPTLPSYRLKLRPLPVVKPRPEV
jgi:hypothetical protein